MLPRESCEWRNAKPAWWLLYGIAALLVAMIGLVEAFVPGMGLREILEAVTVVGGFALISFWLRLNRIALELKRERRQT